MAAGMCVNSVHFRLLWPDLQKDYYVLICNSSNDDRVLSDIRDLYPTLTAQGFREIIGIRDVYPQPYADIPAIRSDFAFFAPNRLSLPS